MENKITGKNNFMHIWFHEAKKGGMKTSCSIWSDLFINDGVTIGLCKMAQGTKSHKPQH